MNYEVTSFGDGTQQMFVGDEHQIKVCRETRLT